ncbi:hypothetical protein AOQ84DRAFT_352237, partial [Glonium stellatum]
AIISRLIKINNTQKVYISFCPASKLISEPEYSPLPCRAVTKSATHAYSANPMSGGGGTVWTSEI